TASLGLLDDQGAQVGATVLQAGRLERLEQLGGDGAGRLLDADFLAALAEVVVGDPDGRPPIPGRPRQVPRQLGEGRGERPNAFEGHRIDSRRRDIAGATLGREATSRFRARLNREASGGSGTLWGWGRPPPRSGDRIGHFFSSNSTSMTSSGLLPPPLDEGGS